MIDLPAVYVRYLDAVKAGEPEALDAYLDILSRVRKQNAERGERDPMRLYVTDVTRCPRSVYNRLTGEPETPLVDSRKIMFRQADTIEWDVAAACLYAGILADFQFSIPIDDHENWGGRGDFLLKDADGIVIDDVKTTRSRNFEGSYKQFPKRHNSCQVCTYEKYLHTGQPQYLMYIDRGGSHPPEHVEAHHVPHDEIEEKMCALDDMRERIVTTPTSKPDILPQRLFRKNVRELTKSRIQINQEFEVNWSGEIYRGPHWECSDAYCGYYTCPAKRNHDTLLCKMTAKEGCQITSAGKRHMDELIEYIANGVGDE